MPRNARHRQPEARSRRVLKRVLAIVGVFLVVITTGAVVVVKHLEGNITGIHIGDQLGHRPKPKVHGPVNVLVMGDDTRKGQGPQIGGSTPGLSDTTILLHLSANRKFAYGVSLPRDAMVERPSCKTSGGDVVPGGLTQFNAAYAIGGPLCTVKTVEQLTGVPITHFAVIKFSGFRQMVDAIGGVQVCVPEQIDDPQSNIHFSPGTYTVDGEQALNYVRVRHGVGDGSDIGRMKRQQAFIASMINKVVSAGTLANPVRLYHFLDAATKSLITDQDFAHLGSLASLGSSLKNIGLDHIKFITVPYEAYPPDPNRVQWAPEAKKLWKLIINDEPLTPRFETGVINAADTPGSKHHEKGNHKPGSGSGPSNTPTDQSTPSQDEIDQAHLVGLCA